MTLQMTCNAAHKHESLKDVIRLQQPIQCMSNFICMAAMYGRHDSYQDHQLQSPSIQLLEFATWTTE